MDEYSLRFIYSIFILIVIALSYIITVNTSSSSKKHKDKQTAVRNALIAFAVLVIIPYIVCWKISKPFGNYLEYGGVVVTSVGVLFKLLFRVFGIS